MNKTSFFCNDPHAVYDRIFPLIRVCNNKIILKRFSNRLLIRPYLLRLFFVFASDLTIAINTTLYVLSGRKIVIREFSIFTCILLLPVCFFTSKESIIFNINHNLNSKTYRILSRNIFHKIQHHAFILMPPYIKKEFPLLHTLDFFPINRGEVLKHTSISVFHGKRTEQETFIRPDLLDLRLNEISSINMLKFHSNLFSRISDHDLEKIISQSGIIVIPYTNSNYIYRHSGLILESLVGGATILSFSNPYTHWLSTKYERFFIFDSLDDLTCRVQSLLSNQSRICDLQQPNSQDVY